MATNTAAQRMVDVVTPAAGESVTEGTILEWRVKVGDFIKVDDTIVEISTDKVDLELPAPASGTVSEILVEEGDTVTVGQVIARIDVDGSPRTDGSPPPQAETDGRPEADGDQVSSGAPTAAPASALASGAPPAPADGASSAEAPAGVKASPVAARAAAVEGVDLASVPGSGPAGRITKSDVLSSAFGGAAPSSAPGAPPSGNGAPAAAPGTAVTPSNGREATTRAPSAGH